MGFERSNTELQFWKFQFLVIALLIVYALTWGKSLRVSHTSMTSLYFCGFPHHSG